ncbi:MAG: tRNA 5-methoxyuridine(34)/uridine 5-oxyacetic acid(34) synthase CmoB [Candidatus Azotimanducaceae bacterium]
MLPVFDRFFELIEEEPLHRFQRMFKTQTLNRLNERPHGREDEWQAVLKSLPNPTEPELRFRSGVVELHSAEAINPQALTEALAALRPWRKGPFNIFGVEVDAEWRSDWKWARLAPHIGNLAGRAVLDIGCGNGYYLYRMLEAGARCAFGIDPTRLFSFQFQALQQLQPQNAAALLPLLDEDLPDCAFFDTVFSMGVLYHRRDPIAHLKICHDCLAPGGELVLETLVLPPRGPEVLKPPTRYAQMRNVWEIPNLERLQGQLEQAGFTDIRILDITQTTIDEQRATRWMTFQSLQDFLDPENSQLTIEGHPAPTRAIVSAKRTHGSR